MFDIEQSRGRHRLRIPQVRILSLVFVLILLSSCTVHPITGRDQMVMLPAAQIAYANADFSLFAGANRIAASRACVENCAGVERMVRFSGRVRVIGAQLAIAARQMAPELFERIGPLSIEVDNDLGVATASSAGGRIVIGAGIAGLESHSAPTGVKARAGLEPGLGGLEPSDVLLAFLLAREIAHVIARHAEEDSGASIVVSAIGLLIPGANVIARFLVSRVSAGALRETWAAEQAREADEIAFALLERCALSVLSVSFGIERGLDPARLPGDAWGDALLRSVRRIDVIAASRLRLAEPDGFTGLLAWRPDPGIRR